LNKILVTGAAGFIGSHLVEKCVELGFRVRAFVRYNSRSDWGWLEHSPKKNDVEVVGGDIRDYDSVLHAMRGCQEVFHLAALIGIPYSYESPLAYIKTNVEGTYNVLEAARTLGVEKLIVTSTSETYGTAQYLPIDEKHPLVGQSPYAASKIAADQLTISYYRSFGLPVKIIRPFNTYGPRQSGRAFIPAAVIQVLTNRPSLRLGNLRPIRDFSFVADMVEAFLAVFESDGFRGEVVNAGSNSEISMRDLVELIQEIAGSHLPVSEDEERVRPDGSEVERLRCDNGNIISRTSWRPRTSLRRGLEATIDWMRNRLGSFKSDLYNV
jgi:NAD dependent epimerase/dehydratase